MGSSVPRLIGRLAVLFYLLYIVGFLSVPLSSCCFPVLFPEPFRSSGPLRSLDRFCPLGLFRPLGRFGPTPLHSIFAGTYLESRGFKNCTFLLIIADAAPGVCCLEAQKSCSPMSGSILRGP